MRPGRGCATPPTVPEHAPKVRFGSAIHVMLAPRLSRHWASARQAPRGRPSRRGPAPAASRAGRAGGPISARAAGVLRGGHAPRQARGGAVGAACGGPGPPQAQRLLGQALQEQTPANLRLAPTVCYQHVRAMKNEGGRAQRRGDVPPDADPLWGCLAYPLVLESCTVWET